MLKLVLALLFICDFAYSAQPATVVTEGAIVYKSNSFDAAILGYFSAGKKIRVSSKVYGAFYRVRFKAGVIGYISDIDVQVKGGGFSDVFSNDKNKRSKSLGKNRPFLGKSTLGFTFADVAFADTVGAFNDSSNISMAGLSFTTPLSFFDGAFTLAFNGLYSLETPSLYEGLSISEPEGYVFISDAQLLFSLASFLSRKLTIYLGSGALFTYTNISVVQGTSQLPISTASFGASFSLGMVYDFGGFSFRFEPKYFVEEDAYMSLGATFAFAL